MQLGESGVVEVADAPLVDAGKIRSTMTTHLHPFNADTLRDALHEPLQLLPAVALSGGVAMFYAADIAYRWRDHHELVRDRLVASAACLLIIPLSMTVPAWAALAALTAVGALRLVWELVQRPRIGPVAAGNVQ